MARRLTTYLAGAAFALTAAGAAAAYAQAAAPDASRAAAEADRDAGASQRIERHIIIRDDKDGNREFRMERHERHMDMAEHLRTLLQLKPGQETALQAYVAATRPPHADHDHMDPAAMRDGDHPKTTPERLADMEKHLADEQTRAHARIDATRKFYAQLEPSQKKVFDEMPMLMMGPHGGPGEMMMMHGPMKIRFEHPPMPPMPPVPPVPPAPPAPPRL